VSHNRQTVETYLDGFRAARGQHTACLFVSLAVLGATVVQAAPAQDPTPPSREDVLLSAVLLRDPVRVKALLEQGASPEARNKENGRTALFFAAEIGDRAVTELLLQHGANVAARDTLHGETPVGAASRHGHVDVVRLLLARDGGAAEGVAWNALMQRNGAVLDAALETKRLPAESLSFLLDEAERSDARDLAERLRRAGASPPKPIVLAEAALAGFVGSYRSSGPSRSLEVSPGMGGLQVTLNGASLALVPLDPTFFVREGHRFPTLRFEVKEGASTAVTVRDGDEWTRYERIARD
jgi:hypothetical protein